MLTVQQIFDLSLKMGIAADPRGKPGVDSYLAGFQKEYDKLSEKEREKFDQEKLSNPYLDSGIHFDDGQTKVKRVLAGIDIGVDDLLLASRLSDGGHKIDLVIAHHPIGKGLARLAEVMDLVVDVYHSYGVPIHQAEKIMEERMKIVERSLHPTNHYRVVDAAKLLGVNLINTHTITDNLVDNFLRTELAEKQPRSVGDIMEVLLEIPEYKEAAKMSFGPQIVSGSAKSRAGKYVLEMTGGTEPSNKVYEELSRAGFSTAISMHMREDHLTKATEHHLNVVMAGHMSSDSLGMNLFLDELEKKDIEVVPCGGLIRFSRNKKKK